MKIPVWRGVQFVGQILGALVMLKSCKPQNQFNFIQVLD